MFNRSLDARPVTQLLREGIELLRVMIRVYATLKQCYKDIGQVILTFFKECTDILDI